LKILALENGFVSTAKYQTSLCGPLSLSLKSYTKGKPAKPQRMKLTTKLPCNAAVGNGKSKGKAIPLLALTGPEVSSY
jgi:hypothetical protein